MKNKKGFTLVELLGVITILGILALIAVPTIDAIMTKNREKVYNTQIETIKNGLKTWGDGNALALPENSGEYLMITLGILKKAGFVDEDIKDPTTDSCFANDMVLTITKVGEGYSYYVDEESGKGGKSSDCEAPTADYYLILNGDTNIELLLGDTYEEAGYIIIDSVGNYVADTVTITITDKDGNIVPAVDTTSYNSNIYTITYEYAGIKKTRRINYSAKVEYVFNYTGNIQEVELAPGKWKLEVWGAQGGSDSNTSYVGGKGGYSTGIIDLSEITKVYVVVGEKGANGIGRNAYNGGGMACGGGGSGGGATHIATATGELASLSTNQSSVLVVAGAGGGGSSYSTTAGAGGGTNGIAGAGQAGTQTRGGYTSLNTSASGFGKGGGYSVSCYSNCGAGGAGWYGGAIGGNGSGGGGSGYINPSLASTSTIAGNQSFLDPDGTTVIGHSGNGYARITRVY